MLEDFRKNLKGIFESVEYDTEITEEQSPTNDFIHSGNDGVSYSIKVEKDKNQFNVLDQHGNIIDIFLPTMVNMDGGLPKQKRKEIMDDYNQNHSKEEEVAEGLVKIEETPLNAGMKAVDEAAKKGKESHGGAKHGEGPMTKGEVKSKDVKSAQRQEAKKEIQKELIDETEKK